MALQRLYHGYPGHYPLDGDRNWTNSTEGLLSVSCYFYTPLSNLIRIQSNAAYEEITMNDLIIVLALQDK